MNRLLHISGIATSQSFWGKGSGTVPIRAKSTDAKTTPVKTVTSDNVIILPFVQSDESMKAQELLFSATDSEATPSWLVEQVVEPKPVAKRTAKIKRPTKKPAAKRVAAKKVQPGRAKRTAKSKAKAPVRPRGSSIANKQVAPQPSAAPAIVAPLPRSQSPVVWRINGPVDVLRYWLRSASRGMLAIMAPKGRSKKRPTEAKLRTRTELLREIAILREENTMMREKLGLPAMPFGRQVADGI